MSRKATGCMFSRILNEGDAEDRSVIMSLLQDQNVTNIDLARRMTRAGRPMSEHTVRSHRKADCSCGWL